MVTMKLRRVNWALGLFNVILLLVQILCLPSTSEAFSLSQSYGNFAHGNSNNGMYQNGNSESTEASYEPVAEESLENLSKITPSPSSPLPHSTYFVTASRYNDPSTEENDNKSFPEKENFVDLAPAQSENLGNRGQPKTSGEESASSQFSTEISETPIFPMSSEMTTVKSEQLDLIATPINAPFPISDMSNQLENGNENAPTTEESSNVVDDAAELVAEPVPTPMALISSNGEGSNPPLEEEFAEAFKKVGPNGRRRRIRPGGGRRRVRMRVRKNKGGSSEGDNETTEEPQKVIESEDSNTVRPRRFRSTTQAPDLSTSLETLKPSTPIREDQQNQIRVTEIHSGSTGISAPPQEPQVEKPQPGGYTEKISTYFVTPTPFRISTTGLPKMDENLESLESNNVIPNASTVSKDDLWSKQFKEYTAASVQTTTPSASELERSESVRMSSTVAVPILENRAFTPSQEIDYDSGPPQMGNYPPPENNGPFAFKNVPDNGPFPPSNGPDNSPFAFPQSGGAPPYFSEPPPYHQRPPFGRNPPFPPPESGPRQRQRMRSHYDGTKDQPFPNNQRFRNPPPYPLSGEQGGPPGPYDNARPTGSGQEVSVSDQMDRPDFDQHEFPTTEASTGSTFNDAPPNINYGKRPNYNLSGFKSSPVDPLINPKGQIKMRPQGPSTQLQRPSASYENDPGYNYPSTSPSGGSGPPPPGSLEGYPPQEHFDNGIEADPGLEFQNHQMNHHAEYHGPSSVPNYHAPPHENDIIPHEGHHNDEMNYQHQPPPFDHQMRNFSDPQHDFQNNEHSLAGPPPPISSQGQGPPPAVFPGHFSGSGPGPSPGPGDHPSGPAPGFPPRPHMNPGMNHPLSPLQFFRNNMQPSSVFGPHPHPRFAPRLPLPNSPFFSVTPPGPKPSYEVRPPSDFQRTSSSLVNLPLPGLNKIPPPPSEQQALSEVIPHHHFPPHTHSIAARPDYEPANPPLPMGHPMEINFGHFNSDLNNHLEVDHHPPSSQQHHNFHDHQHHHSHGNIRDHHGHNSHDSVQDHHHHYHHGPLAHNSLQDHHQHGPHGHTSFDQPPSYERQTNPPSHTVTVIDHDHRDSNDHQDRPGFDILSAYYDNPPPTVGTDYTHQRGRPQKDDPTQMPYQYSNSDGGGLDHGLFSPNAESHKEQSEDTEKEKKKEEKNMTAMYSDTPYVLMFPQLVPEAAMIPPPPKILTKDVPVVQASTMTEFSPEGKPILGPGMKAVPVHPRQQLYQVLAKAHYDKALQKYMEARKKPPSTIYTPYGILVPMGPSASASTNHENYAKLESYVSKAKSNVQVESSPLEHYPKKSYLKKGPNERPLLHLLLGKKGALGHIHLFKSASLKNGRLKQQLDFKANVEPALDSLAEKLALKLSTAKYLLTAPAKLGIKAFTKHAGSYSESQPLYSHSPLFNGGGSRSFGNNMALGSELREMLAGTRGSQFLPKNLKGEEVDPVLKNELKSMLKDRLKEVLDEADHEEVEKERLKAIASNSVQTSVPFPFPASASNLNKWSSYLSMTQSDGGLFGTIKRLFFGNPASPTLIAPKSDFDTGSHPFGLSSSTFYGRKGLPSTSSKTEPTEQNQKKKKVKKQLEKWLDMVLKTSDMATSDSSNRPVYVKPPTGKAIPAAKSDGNSLSSLSLKALGFKSMPSSSSSSSFDTSNWPPFVTSALRSVFNFPPSSKVASSSLLKQS